MCLSRLPHLLTSGDAAAMNHDCLFVVRLHAERSTSAVQVHDRDEIRTFRIICPNNGILRPVLMIRMPYDNSK